MRVIVTSLFITVIVLISAMAALAVRLNHSALRLDDVVVRASAGDLPVSAAVLTVSGRITRVNHVQRSVTLEVASDRKVTLSVENRRDLANLKVGEWIALHYYELVTVRVRKPGEKLPSGSLVRGIVMSPMYKRSLAWRNQRRGIAVSLINVDKSHATLSVAGADGVTEKVRARNRRALLELQSGDELVVSNPRAIATSVSEQPGG